MNFSYVVASGDSSADLELSASTPINLDSGTFLRDIVGNNAILTFPAIGSADSLSGSKAIVVDGIRPTAPSAVAFSLPSETINPSRQFVWNDSTDANFLTHNVKLCEVSTCDNSCVAATTKNASPSTLVGTAGKSFYACVQGQDTAGNTTAWVPSSTAAVIDASPTFTGLTAFDVLGSWNGMEAKIRLSFGAPPTGHITHYKVYISSSSSLASFDLNNPYVTIARGDAIYDSNPSDNQILITRPAIEVNDAYYLVRYVDEGGVLPG